MPNRSFLPQRLWLSLAIAFSACVAAASAQPPTAHHYFSKSKHAPTASWSYDGPTGPGFWAKLDPAYQVAATGKQQSPVALSLTAARPETLPALIFDYRPEKVSALNNGHTVQHNGSPGSFLRVGDEVFSLEQFHGHSPSEHTLDGKSFPLEIHFVHKSKAGEVLVVGVFVQKDERSKLETPLFNDLPKVAGELVDVEVTRSPTDFLPRSREYVTYTGSFTTPPCTENVRWIVMKEPLGVRRAIIERFAAILKGNNRPLQALNGRDVRKSANR